ncbi:MAG: ABC transporter permease [Burkholderiaceae bacterium]|nr:ABC transporter permease [Microbacteriaceae bacterium]
MTQTLLTSSPRVIEQIDWKGRAVSILPLAVLVVLVLIVTSQQPNFVGIASVRGLLESMAPILLLALGQMFVILTGGIDLSFAVTASFGTVLLALWIPELGALGVLAMLATTTLIGLINGFVIAKAQIPSFIATLGALGLYSGLGLAISGASTIRISTGYEAIGWITDLRVAQLPLSALLVIVVAIVISVAMRVLASGKSFHAIGLAEKALLMSGGSTVRIRILAFTLCGLFSGLAGVMLAASQRSGGPTLADSLQLPAIAAVVIGGTAITGGVGGAIKTLIGALIIVMLRVGLSAVGVDPSFEQIVYGVVIIAAVVLTIDRSRIGVVK